MRGLARTIVWTLSAAATLSAGVALAQPAPPAGSAASQPAPPQPPKLKFPLGDDAVVLELDQRYVNSVWGFSFRPPVNTQRAVDPDVPSRVNWFRVQDKTGALMWTLSVSRVSLEKAPDDQAKLAAALAAELGRQENFRVDKHQVARAAGMTVIHLRGRSGVRFQRQSWLQTAPKEYLAFRLGGPDEIADKLDKLMDLCLESVQLGESAGAARKQTLTAGAKFLDGLTADRVALSIRPEPQWFLLSYQGKKAGFTRVVETAKTLRSMEGYAVRSWSLIEIPKTPVRLNRRESFVSNDRKYERWRDQWQTGSGKTADNGAEDGMLHDGVLICDVDPGGGQKVLTYEYRLKAEAEYYLPHAVGWLLPRMLDLSKSGSCAFCTYAGARNVFEIRTVTVVGPADVTVGSNQVRATKVLDLPSDDAKPSTAYYSARGELLRLESPDGLVMEASDAAAVRKAYPKADAIVKALGL
ncbi:MAG: hypothetical protein BWX88_04528 [Planctomycetes bacterium ADurb.Bin126]|nr:MAG: hypothetical protein BWX88_04528 [Planctomycetes bacterium ADurb.Bin126]HOD84770.1 hypothetical protein [Phycisphaerae bacterium]HQL74285.1 hypothetical protein [Phycisphaerae bacterium]